jgi:hypothetical protein
MSAETAADKTTKVWERAMFAVRRLSDDDFGPFLLSELSDYLYNCGEVEREKAMSQIAHYLEDYATVIPKKEEDEEVA